jgi:hypothetical protein
VGGQQGHSVGFDYSVGINEHHALNYLFLYILMNAVCVTFPELLRVYFGRLDYSSLIL